jgi:HEAT repeat protein
MSGRDDEPSGAAPVRIDGYAAEFLIPRDHMLAWTELAQGPHQLSFRHVSGASLGIHALIVARVGAVPPDSPEAVRLRSSSSVPALKQGLASADSEVRAAAAWSLGQSPARNQASAGLITALRDTNPIVRGLAALALRDSPAAIPALIEALKDPDSSIRMIAAEDLGRLHAASATQALIAVAQTKDEHLHVLRNVVTALAAIGPPAAAAIPALEALKSNPRLRYPATAAQQRISSSNLPRAPGIP